MSVEWVTIGEHRLALGESLEVMAGLPNASVDALITDPPYSSGGTMRSDRMAAPAAKYQQSGTEREYFTFTGDNRDQRSWIAWCTVWLTECQRIVKPGGYVLIFTDWRQLPATTDALQAGGFVWRGVVPWDKGLGSRAPHKGYFRHQCEYVVWGTNGHCEVPPLDDPRDGPWPGCFQVPVVQDDKHHITGKPTKLMRLLVQCAPPGGVVFDPFSGSFTTAEACLREGRVFVGAEKVREYFDIGTSRLRRAAADVQCDLFAGVA